MGVSVSVGQNAVRVNVTLPVCLISISRFEEVKHIGRSDKWSPLMSCEESQGFYQQIVRRADRCATPG